MSRSTTFDLHAIRHALAEAVRNITGIKRSWPYIIDYAPEVPAAYIGAGDPAEFNVRMVRGSTRTTLVVVVVAGRFDTEESQAFLDSVMSVLPPDDESGEPHVGIVDAVAADPTLGGTCSAATVVRATDLRPVTIAAVDYLALDFTVEVNT